MSICPIYGHILMEIAGNWLVSTGDGGAPQADRRRSVAYPPGDRAMSKQIKSSNGCAQQADGSSFSKTHAHEVTDAITAVVINAQAGLRLLCAQSPDLEKVRRALNSIANDGKRAGEIV